MQKYTPRISNLYQTPVENIFPIKDHIIPCNGGRSRRLPLEDPSLAGGEDITPHYFDSSCTLLDWAFNGCFILLYGFLKFFYTKHVNPPFYRK